MCVTLLLKIYGTLNIELWNFPGCRVPKLRRSASHATFFTYRSFATRVPQLIIRHFWVIGIERNVCRCTFNRYSVITQFVKLATGEQLCRRCTHRKLQHFKTFKSLSWKIIDFALWHCCVVTLLCCDTAVLWHCFVVTLLCCRRWAIYIQGNENGGIA